MPVDGPKLGQKIELDVESRRRFLKMLGAGATATGGLGTVIERAYGEQPEGVPLVHTYDAYGNPDRVRIVAEERYQKIKAYENLPPAFDDREAINGVRLEQLSDDPTELGLEVSVDPAHEDDVSAERLETALGAIDMPASVVPEAVESEHHDCRTATYATMKGGIEVGAARDDGIHKGTLGLVAYDSVDGAPVIVTADHLTVGTASIYQPADLTRPVGDFKRRSSWDDGEDVTSYELHTDVDYSATEIVDNQNAVGTWTFSGLSDETSWWGSVACTLSGNESCTVDNSAVGTTKNAKVQHQVDMEGDYSVDGDSGGAWVDGDGYVVAFHSGVWGSQDVGAAGQEALDAIDVTLAPYCSSTTESC